MNAKIIAELYSKVTELNAGAHIVNFDLHVHTPASKDFKAPKEMPEKEKYLSLLDETLANNIEIIAITDHNTFEGYNKITKYLAEDRIARKKYKAVLILCGIEITCYSSHLLAIFDTNFSVEQQNQFLFEIGIDKDSQGTEEAMADELGPSALLQKINEYAGIAILAHADTEKGFLYSFFNKRGNEIVFKGKSLAKIIKSPYLYGIQVCSDSGEVRIKQVLSNKDYSRQDRNLSYLYFSDVHGLVLDGQYTGISGKNIGALVSKAKLSHKSFNSLKMALSDVETRIVKTLNQTTYPMIIGCAVKSDILKSSDNNFTCFRFSNQLNCIIGSRGTGKSTLLGIIRDVLEYEAKGPSLYNDRYCTAVVFISIENKIYAISNDDSSKNYRSIYEKRLSNDSFSKINGNYNFLNLFLTKTYGQGELYDYHINPSKVLEIVDDFIMWKHYTEYGNYIQTIKQTTEDVGQLFERCMKQNKNLIAYMKDEGIDNIYIQKYYDVLKTKDNIVKLRDAFVERINRILVDKLKLSITFTLDNETYKFLTKRFPNDVARKANRYYDYEISIKNFLISIIEKSKIKMKFDFFALLITDQVDKILEEYRIVRNEQNMEFLHDIRQAITPAELMLYLENEIKLEYNVNSGVTNVKPIFRDSKKLSLGQNAVALLLIILTASQGLDDNRPLLMDQPEDDLDNSYIFNTLVEEFRRSKSKRQLIISTHNANIPVAADAENIIVLKYNGEYGYLCDNGSLDNPAISKAVLDILEGGELAMRSRNDKYRNVVKIIN